jgi:heme-degrading monooxygenase HmoA
MGQAAICIRVAAAVCASALTMASRAAPPEQAPEDAVTVVVEVALASNTRPSDALAALGDMRAMMKTQPGYLSEAFLQNLNPSNTPHFVHVSRWVSMAHWSALFEAPEFGRLSTHGSEHYSVTTSAYLPAK